MASFNITNVTSTYFHVEITLENPFDKKHYTAVGLIPKPVPESDTGEESLPCVPYHRETPKLEGSTSNVASFDVSYNDDNGFTAGKTYEIYAYAQDKANGRYWRVGSKSVTITIPDDSSSRPEKPSKPYLSGKKRYLYVLYGTDYTDCAAGLELGCKVGSNIGYIEWEIWDDTFGNWRFQYRTSPEETTLYDGLDFSTEYQFRIRVYNKSDKNLKSPSDWSEVFYTSTAPMYWVTYDGDVGFCNLYLSQNKPNQIEVRFTSNSLDESYTYAVVLVTKNGSSSYIENDSNKDKYYIHDERPPSLYYSNLAGGTYTVTVRGYYDYNGTDIQPVDEYGNEICFTKTFTVERPSKFYWTNEEKNIFENQRAVKLISHERINDLIRNVYDMLADTGHLNDTPTNKYGTDAKTFGELLEYAKFTEQDTKLYAHKFNIINHCICKMLYTGIDDKQSGEKVFGKYFTEHLVDTLNSV